MDKQMTKRELQKLNELLSSPLHTTTPFGTIKLHELLKEIALKSPPIHLKKAIADKIKTIGQSMFLNLWSNDLTWSYKNDDKITHSMEFRIDWTVPYLYNALFPAILNHPEWKDGKINPLTKGCINAFIQNEEIKQGVIEELTTLITSNELHQSDSLRKIMSIVDKDIVKSILINIIHSDKMGCYNNLSMKTVCEYVGEDDVASFLLKDNSAHLTQFLKNKIETAPHYPMVFYGLPLKAIQKTIELNAEYLLSTMHQGQDLPDPKEVFNTHSGLAEHIEFLNTHPEHITVTNIEPLFKMEIYLDELMKSNLKIFQIQLNLNCENISLNDIPKADIEAIFHYNRTDIENFNIKFQNVLNIQNTKVTNYEENVAERM